MTPLTDLERLFGEEMARTVPPVGPMQLAADKAYEFAEVANGKRNREATPVPALPGNHEGSEI